MFRLLPGIFDIVPLHEKQKPLRYGYYRRAEKCLNQAAIPRFAPFDSAQGGRNDTK